MYSDEDVGSISPNEDDDPDSPTSGAGDMQESSKEKPQSTAPSSKRTSGEWTAVNRNMQNVEHIHNASGLSSHQVLPSIDTDDREDVEGSADQSEDVAFPASSVRCVEMDSALPSTSRGGYGVPPPCSRKTAGSYVEQVSREEMQIGEQARLLLNLFIQERSRIENSPVEPTLRHVCPADKLAFATQGFSDERLSDIALTLRKIGDNISQNIELNNFIEQVPVDSTKEIFMKVCFQIFQDGNMNWGRVVALFYFAYRLVVRTLMQGIDNIPWVRQLLTWAVDFIMRYVASWIIGKGGWGAIKEWFGISNQTWALLLVGSLTFAAWAYLKKN